MLERYGIKEVIHGPEFTYNFPPDWSGDGWREDVALTKEPGEHDIFGWEGAD